MKNQTWCGLRQSSLVGSHQWKLSFRPGYLLKKMLHRYDWPIENYFQSNHDTKHLELQDDISELERKITNDSDNENLPDEPHQSLSELIEKARVTVANYAAEPTIAAQPTTALNLQPPQTSWGSSLSRLRTNKKLSPQNLRQTMIRMEGA
ncbi:hypothetical protein JHK87_012249 [Glycine soja]|nr:hypothetical protein JHK87_012249 [Glycine soja]